MEEEKEVGKFLVNHWGIEWNTDENTSEKIVNIEVHSPRWSPRYPIDINQEWNAESRKLTLARFVSNL